MVPMVEPASLSAHGCQGLLAGGALLGGRHSTSTPEKRSDLPVGRCEKMSSKLHPAEVQANEWLRSLRPCRRLIPILTSQRLQRIKTAPAIAGAVQLDRYPGGFRSNGHGYMASEPPSPSGQGPEPLRVSAMSNFTNTGLVQMRIVASLLV